MRLSASCVAISLDPDVTVRTQAVYPRLFPPPKAGDPAKCGKRAGPALVSYFTLLRVEIASFHIPRQRRGTRLCGSPVFANHCGKGGSAKVYGGNPSVKFYDRDGCYPLRCPPEPGLSSPPKAGRPLSTCPVYQGPIPSLLYSLIYLHPDSLPGEYVLSKPL